MMEADDIQLREEDGFWDARSNGVHGTGETRAEALANLGHLLDTIAERESEDAPESEPPRLNSPLPSQADLTEGALYLLPTSMIRRASGGIGERYQAVKVRVVEKHVSVDESTQRVAEGYTD